jgi:hypothetical protein
LGPVPPLLGEFLLVLTRIQDLFETESALLRVFKALAFLFLIFLFLPFLGEILEFFVTFLGNLICLKIFEVSVTFG